MRLVLALAAAAVLVACSQSEPQGGSGGAAGSAGSLEIHHDREGTGSAPGPTDVVKVHYTGTFADGKVFDSSVSRGEPAKFPLNRVISCWTQGLQQMKVGGKAKLTCPPHLAYGPEGAPPAIPPNATLYFEVELLAIE
jgi:FKBP-type peptidyl-prolyl cis-trans isomerase FkpA